MRIVACLRDQRGGPAVEFAMIFPVAMIMMLGLGDLAFQGYVNSVLTGAVQKAGRDTTIQGNGTTTEMAKLDAKVASAVKAIAPTATFVASRSNFDNYTSIGPEPYTDANHNGTCDHGEVYTDYNNDSVWDSNMGTSGAGGASDVSLYTMTVTYPRLFPVARLIGWGATVTASASTILKNQPYQTQTTTTPVTRNC